MAKKRKMRSGGGKAKGSAFERKVASMIIKATKDTGFHFEKEDCYRTPMSGGHIYAKQEEPSDLVLSKRLRKVIPIAVECKFRKTINMYHFTVPFEQHEKSWEEKNAIDQVLRATKKSSYYPVVILKNNREPIVLVMRLADLKFLFPRCKIGFKFSYNEDTWCALEFEAFLKAFRKHLKGMKHE